jgi:hypothetical protein
MEKYLLNLCTLLKNPRKITMTILCFNVNYCQLLGGHFRAPWWNTELTILRRTVRRAERQWRKCKLQVHREIYLMAKGDYHKGLQLTKRKHLAKNIEESIDNPKKMWWILNSSVGRGQKLTLPEHSCDTELANRFNEFFIKKIEDVYSSIDNGRGSLPTMEAATSAQLSDFTAVTELEVREVLLRSPRKSCVYDTLPLWLMLKTLPSFLPVLTSIVNWSLVDGMPDVLKHSILSPILKKKNLDSNILSSYRPVSNTQTITKLIERIVLRRLTQYLESNDLYEHKQSAFRKHHSCETALLFVQNIALGAMDSGNVTLLVLLDLSSAFDTVNHTTLLTKLSSIGVCGNALTWFRQYLYNRWQSVKIGNSQSDSRPIMTGVPQGSVLGPTLFSIYLTGIGEVIRKHGIEFVIFADDIQLLATSTPLDIQNAIVKLEQCISELASWLSNHYLMLNAAKTELLVIGTKAQLRKVPNNVILNVGGQPIRPSQNSVRDLGVLLNSEMSFSEHVVACCRRAYSYIKSINRMKSALSISHRVMLVKALVLSQLDYGSVLLHNIQGSIIQRMRRVIHAAFRMVWSISKKNNVSQKLKQYRVLPMERRIILRLSLIIRKLVHTCKPAYLYDLVNWYVPSRNLRSADHGLLRVPRTRTVVGSRAFATIAPLIWNSIPREIRELRSNEKFRIEMEDLLLKGD